MKKVLIDENLTYYRANLHCHSTFSDGRKTPEELKRDYMAHGYSVIAFTDHDVFVTHNDLTDDSFVALNAYELGVDEIHSADKESTKVAHLCYVALDKDIDRKAFEYKDSTHYTGTPDFEREYSPECINEMIRQGREKGFFVTYNHPVWSCEGFSQYSRYKGMNAMEIVNFSSIVYGWDDDVGHAYEELLNLGNRLYCIATDDNHNGYADNDPSCDSYGGYIMIGAEKLEYSQIADALLNGSFYASNAGCNADAPVIKSLVYENGRVNIKTSEARKIFIQHNTRCARACNAPDGGSVTEAEFEVDNAKWFRLVVVDDRGYKSYTNAYFLDELENE